MSALSSPALVAVQKIRIEVLDAMDCRPSRVYVTAHLTVTQAKALLAWIDEHQ